MNDNAHLQRNAVEPDDERTSSNSSDGVCEAIPAVCASEHETVATIDALVASDGLDWTRVEALHLDEYAGMSPLHPSSFRL